MKMSENYFIYRVYEIMISGGDARERPPVVCINRMEEYWRERLGKQELECAESEVWRQLCCDHSLGKGSCEGTGHQK